MPVKNHCAAGWVEEGWKRDKVWRGKMGWKREKGWVKDGVEGQGNAGYQGLQIQLQAASTTWVNVGSSPSCFSSLVPAP